jgi:hypothetical protein
MTEQRTGHMHRATFKALSGSKQMVLIDPVFLDHVF